MSENSSIILNNRSYNAMIKESSLFRHIYPTISCVSPTDMPVIIFGEEGMYKPLFAKLIHYHSKRKHGRFISVDISNIENSSLEDEIFGHEYGSSNNSNPSKIGKLEQANGGSILLNEIDEISSDIQSRLLHVIQHQEFHRIDGNKAIPVDVRIIATASKVLEANVKEGKFLGDLYYRMAVFPMIIPPIREIRNDIELFAKRILKIMAKKLDKPIDTISKEAMEILLNYHWPRNISELYEVIEYAVNLEKTSEIQKSSLPKSLLNGKEYRRFSPPQKHYTNIDSILPLNEMERQALIHALKVTDNNIQLTADALGINRATVYRKLGKYNLLDR